MATGFGISGLKSRFVDWSGIRKSLEAGGLADTDVRPAPCRIVGRSDEEIDLSFLLENLVIPKLIADRSLHSAWVDPVALETADGPQGRAISEADVERFAQLSLGNDARVLLGFVDRCLADGSSVETVFLELLAPAARRLGELWNEDSEDFVGVTMGLWRIQEVLREISLRIPPTSRPGHGQRSALFSPVPGEQHSFGTLMVAETFQRAGWDADVLIQPTPSQLTAKLANRHYDLVGLTVSCDCYTRELNSLVVSIRAVSSNPGVRILIGGRAINDHPALVDQCGADATATDATAAVAIADGLVPVCLESFEKLT
jgi:methanogenic corrinoid protein MtbC1